MLKSHAFSRSRLGIGIATAVALALTLAACSSSKGNNAASTTPTGGASTPAGGGSASTGATSGFKVDLSQCEDPSAPTKPVTGTWTIGYSLPLSGPVAGVVQFFLEGWKARIAAANAAGGVNGVKINVEYADDQFTGDKAKVNETKFIQQDHVDSLNTFGSGSVDAMVDDQTAACVPLLYPSSSEQQFRDISQYPWTIQLLTAGDAEARYDVQYIESQFPNGANIGVAVNSTESGQAEYQAFQQAAQGTNVKIAAVAQNEDSDYNAAATKLQAAHVDAVYDAGISSDCPALVIAMGKIGFKPKFTLNPSNCADTTGYIQAGAAANGNVLPMFLKDPSNPALANDPGLKEYLSQVTSKDKLNSLAVAGWTAADLTINTLKQAARLPGGLTQQNVIDAARDQNYASPMLPNGVTWKSSATEMIGFSGFQTEIWNAAKKQFVPQGKVVPLTAN